jgi:hypothetical protein
MNNKGNMIDRETILSMMKKGRVIVYYGNNILDVTDFKHPGPDTILNELNGKDMK